VVSPDRAPSLLPPGLQRGQRIGDHWPGDVGVGAHHTSEAVSQALVLDDFGNPVLDQPGLVGVAQVVEVHAGLDRLPFDSVRVVSAGLVSAGQGGDPDSAAEVGTAVQPTVGAGEHEPGVGVAAA
jgi:hypothetical protein